MQAWKRSVLWAATGAAGAFVAPADLGAQGTTFTTIERGKYLVQAGDCAACHTNPGGKPFAGGLPIATPFGTIYSTNITPDPQTGIGRYSVDDLYQAMHRGVRRDGEYLYPAFPYPWFTKITRDDVRAMKAYLDLGAVTTAGPLTVKIQHSDTTTAADFTDATGGAFTVIPVTTTTATNEAIHFTTTKRYVRAISTCTNGAGHSYGVFLLAEKRVK